MTEKKEYSRNGSTLRPAFLPAIAGIVVALLESIVGYYQGASAGVLSIFFPVPKLFGIQQMYIFWIIAFGGSGILIVASILSLIKPRLAIVLYFISAIFYALLVCLNLEDQLLFLHLVFFTVPIICAAVLKKKQATNQKPEMAENEALELSLIHDHE